MMIPILVILLSGTLLVNGNTVWQDTFDDSNSLDNYEIVNGELRSDGVLTSLGCDSVDCVVGSAAFYRNSLGSTGTWSFDFNLTSNFNIYFIGIGKVSGHALFPKEGYNLIIRPSLKLVVLDYVTSPITNLASYESNISLVGWMHIDITRDESGNIIVYLDGNAIIETTQKDLTNSEHINIQLSKDSQLDNLIYSNSVDLPTEKSNNDDSPIMMNIILSALILVVFNRKIKNYRQQL
ncbi:MAG: hypothetical protein GPJ54_20445 [Candidatus Heimdallarchaeota archaeon]|nr:hypothetical protein [Candidatus Heimdallarchaeota archaeon]